MSEINFVEVDSKEINKNLVNRFSTALNDTLYPGDERRIFLDQETSVIVGLKNDINLTGRQNLLKYAKGAVLDALGERVNTPRLQAEKAVTTLRYTLSQAQEIPYMIVSGQRATPDGALFFITIDDLTIPAGETQGTVKAQAIETGEKYNGFVPGQINKIVDPIPYVAAVENTEESSGGTETEPDDDGINVWSGYRERIRKAPGGFSTAGPKDAYIYHAMSADANIQDVSVDTDTLKIFDIEAFEAAYPSVDPTPFYTERPGAEVTIVALMKDGEMPTQTVLDKISAKVNDKKVRPLTDHVTVSAPDEVEYDIELTYYISADRAAEEENIRSEIEDTGGAIDIYVLWQKSKLKRAINPDYLRQLMYAAGVYKIDITYPVYTEIEKDQVAICNDINITYGGLL
ncbi:baseplate J-like protein [Oxobacter pfennigii]|uniref:Baseplate J-like protein n=1 Tax=Oxobacter pfennigii TaxID=36849 RepID=A0A0P8W3J6_9CLOT|nr:baseplate J/gp47 family protein [Oxobacter pfennigii]KPU42151.1 baseplate J-like protein [Oxobacter pfennigii]